MEDLIINLADAISSVYLEVISVDSETSEKISNYSLSLCTLSARALQKLRNEVFVFFGSFIFFHVLLKLFLNFQKLILQCFHNLCFDCEWVFTDIMAISFEEKLKQLLLWSFIIKGNNLFLVPCSRIQIDKLSLLYISLPVAPPVSKSLDIRQRLCSALTNASLTAWTIPSQRIWRFNVSSFLFF